MEFLTPGLLGLSAVASAPILVHLLFRPRPKVQPFPTIALLKKSLKRTRAFWRIRHWLLLAMRVAVLLLFVWALARPVFEGASRFVSGAPVSAAIVLDDSYRMSYAPGGGSRFERGRQLALDVVRGLPSGSDVVLLLPARGESTGLLSAAAVESAILAASPSPRIALLGPAIERGWMELGTGTGRGREVYCISDASETAWEGGVPRLAAAQPQDRLFLLDVGSDGPRNATIVSLRVHPPCPLANEPVEVTATVRWTGEPTPRAAEVVLDGQKKGQEDVVADPGSRSATVRFVVSPETGGTHSGVVRLLPSDDLPVDDARAFALNADDAIPVLVVDGAPSSDTQRDEAFFLVTALAPPGLSKRQTMRVTVSPVEEFERLDLSAFRVVLLANVPEVSSEGWNKLGAFAEAGGGIGAFLGDKVRPERWNLPEARRVTGVLVGDLPVGGQELHFAIQDRTHPVLAQFEMGKNGGLQNPVTQAFQPMEPDGEPRPSVPLAWSNGQAAMVESAKGKGKVAVLGTSADADWTDLPRNACFLPFVHQLVKHLAGLHGAATEFTAGDVATVAVDPSAQHASPTLFGPGHQRIRALAVEPGSYLVTFQDTEEPGTYEVMWEADQQVRKKAVAVNVDPRGGDLSRCDWKALSASPSGIAVETATPPARSLSGAISGGASERSLAGPLLTAALGLLALELLVAGRQNV
ncbi:MAG: BatA domain-containing protein [Planctomycetota bacterium]